MIYKQPDYAIPKGKQLRVIISTDAKNEADDQYAIVHSILSPRLDVRGVIAAHFGELKSPTSMEDSYYEILRLFQLMEIEPRVVKKGAPHAIKNEQEAVPSEGAQLIIEEALREDTRAPLFVTVLGPLTDVASACLMCPDIIGRFTVIWIGGGRYPTGGIEYNLKNDVIAARTVMDMGVDLWQVPEDVYQQMLVSIAELNVRVKPYGKLGNYLFKQMIEWGQTWWGGHSRLRTGECWYLGDSPTVGLMLNEHPNDYVELPAPHIEEDMTYGPSRSNKIIRVYNRVDCRFILEDFYAKLQLFESNRGSIEF